MEEEVKVLTSLWYIVETAVVSQQINGPNGPVTIQQQVQIPKFFRNIDELTKFITTCDDEQVMIARSWVDKDGGEIQWKYGG